MSEDTQAGAARPRVQMRSSFVPVLPIVAGVLVLVAALLGWDARQAIYGQPLEFRGHVETVKRLGSSGGTMGGHRTGGIVSNRARRRQTTGSAPSHTVNVRLAEPPRVEVAFPVLKNQQVDVEVGDDVRIQAWSGIVGYRGLGMVTADGQELYSYESHHRTLVREKVGFGLAALAGALLSGYLWRRFRGRAGRDAAPAGA